MVLACVKSPSCDIYPPGKPGQLSNTRTMGSLLCATRQIWRQFSPVPFGRCLVSFLGEAGVWLGRPYPFPVTGVILGRAPAVGQRARSPCQRWRSRGCSGRDNGQCPSAVFASVCTFTSRLSRSLLRNTCEALCRVVGSCLQPKKKQLIDVVVIANITPPGSDGSR